MARRLVVTDLSHAIAAIEADIRELFQFRARYDMWLKSERELAAKMRRHTRDEIRSFIAALRILRLQ